MIVRVYTSLDYPEFMRPWYPAIVIRPWGYLFTIVRCLSKGEYHPLHMVRNEMIRP